MREEPLFGPAIDPGRETYRFLYKMGFGSWRPCLRLDIQPDGSGILTVKGIKGRTDRLSDLHDRRVTVSPEDVTAFRALVQESGFWHLPTRGALCLEYCSEWVMEAARGGKYHLVQRYFGDDVRQIGLMLVRFSGIPATFSY